MHVAPVNSSKLGAAGFGDHIPKMRGAAGPSHYNRIAAAEKRRAKHFVRTEKRAAAREARPKTICAPNLYVPLDDAAACATGEGCRNASADGLLRRGAARRRARGLAGAGVLVVSTEACAVCRGETYALLGRLCADGVPATLVVEAATEAYAKAPAGAFTPCPSGRVEEHPCSAQTQVPPCVAVLSAPRLPLAQPGTTSRAAPNRIGRPPRGGPRRSHWHAREHKIRAMSTSPYEWTLYMDADMIPTRFTVGDILSSLVSLGRPFLCVPPPFAIPSPKGH